MEIYLSVMGCDMLYVLDGFDKFINSITGFAYYRNDSRVYSHKVKPNLYINPLISNYYRLNHLVSREKKSYYIRNIKK